MRGLAAYIWDDGRRCYVLRDDLAIERVTERAASFQRTLDEIRNLPETEEN